MANLHVWLSGSNTAPYETWTKAATSPETALEAATAGDIVYIDDGFVWGFSGSPIIDGGTGTVTDPVIFISVDKATAASDIGGNYSRGAKANSTNDIFWRDFIVSYGIDFEWLDDFDINHGPTRFYDCTFTATSTGANADISLTGNDISVWFYDCTFDCTSAGNANCMVAAFQEGGSLEFHRCKSGSTNHEGLIKSMDTRQCNILINGYDASGAKTTGFELIHDLPGSANDGPGIHIKCNNIRLPTNGVLTAASFADFHTRIEAYNVTTDGTGYGIEVQDYFGTALDETTIVGDATYDGTNGYSIKITTTANATIHMPFIMRVAEFYADANSTITCHVCDSADTPTTLKDSELWMWVVSPDDTNDSVMNMQTGRIRTVAEEANLSTEADPGWTGEHANSKYYGLAETVTGGSAGMYEVWIGVGAASKTVYVDPAIDVT